VPVHPGQLQQVMPADPKSESGSGPGREGTGRETVALLGVSDAQPSACRVGLFFTVNGSIGLTNDMEARTMSHMVTELSVARR
jgi:hypothetical protein